MMIDVFVIFLKLFYNKKSIIALPFDFFFSDYRKEEDNNTEWGRNVASNSQEVSRRCDVRNSLLTPYRLINEPNTYNDSYDVFVPVYEYGCNLQFQTAQEPFVDRYFVCFNDYIHDGNGYSEEQNKQLVMNLGDVLLAVDGVDIAGKSLKDIKCLILYKHQQMVRLTFLNENWFNKFERISVRVADDIPKKRCVENSIVDIYFGIHETI